MEKGRKWKGRGGIEKKGRGVMGKEREGGRRNREGKEEEKEGKGIMEGCPPFLKS